MDTRINFKRLRKDISDLGAIGKDARGGISRPSFSPADQSARTWLKERIQSSGLILRQDGAGNIFGRLDGKGPCIMAGSHIDTVIHGGMFDGSIGVLTALECLRRIQEEGLPRTKPLEVAAFTDEEGNLVGDFLGSRAFLGQLDRELLEKGVPLFGIPFPELLRTTEFTIDSIQKAHTQRPEIETYLEIHIEQGPVLEEEDIPIGIVDRIAGKNYWMCCFQGRSSHAGTTPFELRQDAFLGLADFALKATHLVATQHYGSLVTIGKVGVFPGTFSIVPGRVDFTLDFRSVSGQTLSSISDSLMALARDIASTRGLEIHAQLVDKTDPVKIPARIITVLEKECGRLGYPFMKLPSGAGHDAQILSSVSEIGMIFIPCTDGISHSPSEKIDWSHLEMGANLLLAAILDLAN